VVLTDELKRLCDKAKKGETKEIEAHLRKELKDDYKGSSLIQVDETWILSVTTRGGGEVCLTPESLIAKSAPVQQAVTRPAVAGGGAAEPKTSSSAAKPSAAKPAVQSAAAGGGAASVAQPKPAAAIAAVQSSAAKPLSKLDVKDSNLVRILQQDSNHDALDAYLKQFQKYHTYLLIQKKDGWSLEVFTVENNSTQFTINDPAKSASGATSKVAAKPAEKPNESNCVIM
jgi:hypothetical protein